METDRTPATPRPTAPALTLSIAFGALGVVLLLGAVVSGFTGVFVAAATAAAASLVAALYWRSQLIADWREAKGQHRPPGGIV